MRNSTNSEKIGINLCPYVKPTNSIRPVTSEEMIHHAVVCVALRFGSLPKCKQRNYIFRVKTTMLTLKSVEIIELFDRS